ncbi:MAG TPA: 50S ribosomal protein L25 [Candidatus Peribacterales bacterium]|nr:50S ribosomal protein L25 [Candidatus Peribacterales bacterium]
MATIALTATKRDTALKPKDRLREDFVPGVIYGFKMENTPIEFRYQDFHKVYVAAGESTMLELTLEGKKIPALIHELQFDPVTGRYIHIDFFAPDMTKKVTAHISIRTIGEAPGIKEHGGVLVKNSDHITVKCLPKDLPHDIEIDLSLLANLHDAVKVSDLKMSSAVEIMDDPAMIIVSIAAPRKEEEVTPVEAVAAVGAEGAVAAEGAGGSAPATDEKASKTEKK